MPVGFSSCVDETRRYLDIGVDVEATGPSTVGGNRTFRPYRDAGSRFTLMEADVQADRSSRRGTANERGGHRNRRG